MVSLLTATALLAYYRLRQRKRRFGVHPILRKRKEQGHFYGLFKDLRGDPQRFHRFVRMDEARFMKLLGLIKHRLVKRSNREPLSPAERLLITLRFLATGNSYYSVANAFYVGHATVSKVVAETCKVLAEELMPAYVRFPSTADEWKSIADGFWDRWDLPHTLGAIDGKHVQVKAPPASGTQFHNYKGTFSTVLLAMCDHRYRIIYANWHNYGSSSDAGIFDRSELKRMLKDPGNPLNLPAPDPLPLDPGGHTAADDVPYFFVGDGAFPLMKNLMVPFGSRKLPREDRIYNYRHGRARRMIESTFGLL
ncbi:nuclease HARBI1-like protein [Aphelenchoides avenae]|nr:nuclease HARBI1-like protein [Aphelenchus avenae]